MKIVSFYDCIMTAEGSIDKIKVELDIYYAFKVVRGVHHEKPTRGSFNFPKKEIKTPK